MKVLYIDFMSHIGHKEWNTKLINLLSDFSQVDVCVSDGYFDGYHINNTGLYSIPAKYISKRVLKNNLLNVFQKLLLRIYCWKELKWIFTQLPVERYDVILFSSIEIIAFALFTKKTKYNIAFIDHGINEIWESRIKYRAWRYLNPKITVIVFEDYIKKSLAKKTGIKNRIVTVHHTLTDIYIAPENENREEICFLGPSGSNDIKFIEFIMDSKEQIPRNCSIKLKNTLYKINQARLILYLSRTENEKYYSEIINSDYILIPYGETFNYKVSGVLFDALSLRRKAIIIGNNTLKEYSIKYPHIILHYRNAEEFIHEIDKLEKYNCSEIAEFDKFLKDYSDQIIINELKSLFLCSKKGENT